MNEDKMTAILPTGCDPNEVGTHINEAEAKHCRHDISIKFHEHV
jgi:hypothetical protein